MERCSTETSGKKMVLRAKTGSQTHQSNHRELDGNRKISEAQCICDDSHGCCGCALCVQKKYPRGGLVVRPRSWDFPREPI